MAEQAVELLRDAGFSNDEIFYSGVPAGGDFFDALTRVSTGAIPDTTDDVMRNLANMGLVEDEVDHYAREYAVGHPIVAVKAHGHEYEAATVIRASWSIHNEGTLQSNEEVPHV
jgi:hypothetical protein